MMQPTDDKNIWTIFLIFLRLGFTSFGGPIAHLGYFHDEFVIKRSWLSDKNYADLVALCHFLPGPTSSQVGMAIGKMKAGYAGALAAWLGFTSPSVLLLILLALGLSGFHGLSSGGAIHGLKIVALAVVIQALWGMMRTLCNGTAKIVLMLGTAVIILLYPSIWLQVVIIGLSGVIAALFFNSTIVNLPSAHLPIKTNYTHALIWLGLFFLLLFGLPIANLLGSSVFIELADIFYRAGALVFGGGHVVLPLLQTELVGSGLIDQERFLAGYGVTQAVPGPLFTFAAFIGASLNSTINGWSGAILCTIFIFLPSYLLVMGVLPFWERLAQNVYVQAALSGINASVVGFLLAALYQPMWINTIYNLQDIIWMLIALTALMIWKVPPWLVVFVAAIMGEIMLGLL